MQRYKPFLIIGGLLLLFLTLTLALGTSSSRVDPVADHSSLRANRWGTKALAELCRANGLKVFSWTHPLSRLSPQQGLLCLFDPTRPPTEDDLRSLLNWVKSGGTLIVAADLNAEHTSFLAADLPQDTDEIVLAALGLLGEARGNTKNVVAVQSHDPCLTEVRSLLVPGPYRLRPAKQTDFVTRKRAIRRQTPDALPRLRQLVNFPWQPLVRDEYGSVALKTRYGRGAIYAISEAGVFSNSVISHADNIVFASNLLYGPRVPKVYFEESLHYFNQALSEEALNLDPSRWQLALVAIMAALAVFLLGKAQRFGRPLPSPKLRRRSALEFVDALADLYRRAEARQPVVELLQQSLRRKLALAAGVPPDLPPAALAAAVARRHRISEAQLTALLSRLDEAPGSPPVTDRDLLHLARLAAAYEEIIRHGK